MRVDMSEKNAIHAFGNSELFETQKTIMFFFRLNRKTKSLHCMTVMSKGFNL